MPPAAALLIRAWGSTWRVRTSIPPVLDPRRADRSRRCVYLFWHRTILLSCYIYRGLGICVAQSRHRDGEFAVQISAKFGHFAARGSGTRGATGLLRELMDFARREPGDIGLTPDGPRGPTQQTKPGALFLAAHLGWPVVPVALTARPRKELRSWDRFILPWPFARVGVVAAEPLEVERNASRERLAELCKEVDRRMIDAERAAEELIA